MKASSIVVFILLITTSLSAQSTQPQKTFIWIAWSDTSAAIKEDTKKYIVDNQTLYAHIKENTEMGCTVNIAETDLDGDGKKGYAVCSGSCSYLCGSAGCSFEVFEDYGKQWASFTDECEAVKPAKGGVISSSGHFFPLVKLK